MTSLLELTIRQQKCKKWNEKYVHRLTLTPSKNLLLLKKYVKESIKLIPATHRKVIFHPLDKNIGNNEYIIATKNVYPKIKKET